MSASSTATPSSIIESLAQSITISSAAASVMSSAAAASSSAACKTQTGQPCDHIDRGTLIGLSVGLSVGGICAVVCFLICLHISTMRERREVAEAAAAAAANGHTVPTTASVPPAQRYHGQVGVLTLTHPLRNLTSTTYVVVTPPPPQGQGVFGEDGGKGMSSGGYNKV